MAHVMDACYFVGLRMAKTVSNCQDGYCSNISFSTATGLFQLSCMDSPGLRPVTCQEAEETRQAVYASIPGVDQPLLKRPRRGVSRLPDILLNYFDDIRLDIHSALRKLIFMDAPIQFHVAEIMAQSDQALLRMSGDDVFWQTYSTVVATAPEITELWRLWNLLLEKSLNSPNSYDIQTGLTAPFVHFLYDMGSVLGDIGLLPEQADLLVKVAGRYDPVHRQPYTREYRRALHAEMPAVARAIIIDELVARKRTELGPLFNIILNLKHSSDRDASEWILRHKIIKGMCPKLTSIVVSPIRADTVPFFTKACLSLIELCRDSLPSDRLIAASTQLGLQGFSRIERLPFDHPAHVDFFDASLTWMRGLNSSLVPNPRDFASDALAVFVGTHRPVRDCGVVSEFATPSNFASRDEFEKVMIAFGRAIGLAIAYKGLIYPAVRLGLFQFTAIRSKVSFELLKGVVSLTGAERSSPVIEEDAIMRKVYMPVFFIRRGIQDVLGPMGIDALNEAEWI